MIKQTASRDRIRYAYYAGGGNERDGKAETTREAGALGWTENPGGKCVRSGSLVIGQARKGWGEENNAIERDGSQGHPRGEAHSSAQTKQHAHTHPPNGDSTRREPDARPQKAAPPHGTRRLHPTPPTDPAVSRGTLSALGARQATIPREQDRGGEASAHDETHGKTTPRSTPTRHEERVRTSTEHGAGLSSQAARTPGGNRTREGQAAIKNPNVICPNQTNYRVPLEKELAATRRSEGVRERGVSGRPLPKEGKRKEK